MNFDTWQSRLDDLLSSMEIPETDQIVLGYTCSYVPRVILSVPGLLPVRMRAPGVAGTEIADIYLSSVTCGYTRSLLENVLDGYYDAIDGWVFASGCDHGRRLLDNLDYLRKPEFLHMVDVPHRVGAAALAWYRGALETLCQRLSETFGVDTGETALGEAVHRENQFLAKMQTIADLRKRLHPPISGTEFHRIMLASLTCSRDWLEPLLDLAISLPADRPGTENCRARLMLVGSNLDDTALIQLIESAGGLVVADRFCTGSIPALMPIPEDLPPVEAIARHTLAHTFCPRMMEGFSERLDVLQRIQTEYKVDGIIVTHLKFCDLWGIESSLLTNAFREAGVPVLRLERDYRLNNEGQLRTRIQAFLESMGR